MGSGSVDPFSSLTELAELLATSDRAGYCFVQQMYRFSAGGLTDEAQALTIPRLFESFKSNDGLFEELLLSIVTDPSFGR